MAQNNKPYGLAPMEGVTDFPTRLWFYLISQPLIMNTPFLRVTSTYPDGNIPNVFAPEIFNSTPYKLRCQIMASEPMPFIKTAIKLLNHTENVELNCGCPSKTVTGRGAGSSLLKELDYLDSFIETITKELGPRKLAVKIRTGFENTDQYSEILQLLNQYPLARLTIHGRTRLQKYLGKADWTLINKALSCSFPIVGSGDIVNSQGYQNKNMEVIIGRGAIRNPWIFKEIRDQNPVTLHRTVIPTALLCLGKIYSLMNTDPDIMTLLPLLEEPPGVCPEKWIMMSKKLDTMMNKQGAMPNIRTLGRVKMVWNYLRSSLPECMFRSNALRTKSLEDFAHKLHDVFATGPEYVTMKWNQSYDWVYSGGKEQR